MNITCLCRWDTRDVHLPLQPAILPSPRHCGARLSGEKQLVQQQQSSQRARWKFGESGTCSPHPPSFPPSSSPLLLHPKRSFRWVYATQAPRRLLAARNGLTSTQQQSCCAAGACPPCSGANRSVSCQVPPRVAAATRELELKLCRVPSSGLRPAARSPPGPASL